MRVNPKCDTCGSTLKRIVYGMPSRMPEENDDWVLGGCMVTGDDPEFSCPVCDIETELDEAEIS